MTINGNMKFFELSKALFKNGDTVAVSSGSTSADNLIDGDKTTRWESIGTDDTTTETITITFAASTTISRLLLLNHNFKSYTITPVTTEYILDGDAAAILDDSSDEIEDDGGGIPFINVTSLFSSTPLEGISETDYSISSSYYEFTPVYCSGLLISITEAQESNDVADQEKYCYRVIPTIEVNDNAGTFAAYPVLDNPKDTFNNIKIGINGRRRIKKINTSFTASISAKIGAQQSDVDLIEHLRYRSDDFIIWPNGGNLTSNESDNYHYRFNFSPFKLADVYNVQMSDMSMPVNINNITITPYVVSFNIAEVN